MIQLQQEVSFVPLLQSFYKASQAKFEDEGSGFKAKAHQAVVRLQVSVLILNVQSTVMALLILISKQYLTVARGRKIPSCMEKKCQISRTEFESVYKRLGVELEERVLYLLLSLITNDVVVYIYCYVHFFTISRITYSAFEKITPCKLLDKIIFSYLWYPADSFIHVSCWSLLEGMTSNKT